MSGVYFLCVEHSWAKTLQYTLFPWLFDEDTFQMVVYLLFVTVLKYLSSSRTFFAPFSKIPATPLAFVSTQIAHHLAPSIAWTSIICINYLFEACHDSRCHFSFQSSEVYYAWRSHYECDYDLFGQRNISMSFQKSFWQRVTGVNYYL